MVKTIIVNSEGCLICTQEKKSVKTVIWLRHALIFPQRYWKFCDTAGLHFPTKTKVSSSFAHTTKSYTHIYRLQNFSLSVYIPANMLTHSLTAAAAAAADGLEQFLLN